MPSRAETWTSMVSVPRRAGNSTKVHACNVLQTARQKGNRFVAICCMMHVEGEKVSRVKDKTYGLNFYIAKSSGINVWVLQTRGPPPANV